VIFVDSSFWIGYGMSADNRHAAALAIFDAYDTSPLVTSNLVRGETWTFLRRRSGHGAAIDFLDRLEGAARVEIVRISRELEDEALSWLRRHDEREYSFVDATSFALMRSLRIREAFAFDGDFAAAGFVELRP
jgi:predicted nucleic acid-binding protein